MHMPAADVQDRDGAGEHLPSTAGLTDSRLHGSTTPTPPTMSPHPRRDKHLTEWINVNRLFHLAGVES